VLLFFWVFKKIVFCIGIYFNLKKKKNCFILLLLILMNEQDSFTRCFKSNPPETWNWNVYLFPLWCCGVVMRYFIIFPVRLALYYGASSYCVMHRTILMALDVSPNLDYVLIRYWAFFLFLKIACICA
jgi:hypothetical protein